MQEEKKQEKRVQLKQIGRKGGLEEETKKRNGREKKKGKGERKHVGEGREAEREEREKEREGGRRRRGKAKEGREKKREVAKNKIRDIDDEFHQINSFQFNSERLDHDRLNISPNIIEMVKQHMRVFASNFYIVLVHCPFSRYHFAIIPIYFHQRFVDLSIHISDIRKRKGRGRERGS